MADTPVQRNLDRVQSLNRGLNQCPCPTISHFLDRSQNLNQNRDLDPDQARNRSQSPSRGRESRADGRDKGGIQDDSSRSA